MKISFLSPFPHASPSPPSVMKALPFPEALQKNSWFVTSFLPRSPSLGTGSMGLILRGEFRKINPYKKQQNIGFDLLLPLGEK